MGTNRFWTWPSNALSYKLLSFTFMEINNFRSLISTERTYLIPRVQLRSWQLISAPPKATLVKESRVARRASVGVGRRVVGTVPSRRYALLRATPKALPAIIASMVFLYDPRVMEVILHARALNSHQKGVRWNNERRTVVCRNRMHKRMSNNCPEKYCWKTRPRHETRARSVKTLKGLDSRTWGEEVGLEIRLLLCPCLRGQGPLNDDEKASSERGFSSCELRVWP